MTITVGLTVLVTLMGHYMFVVEARSEKERSEYHSKMIKERRESLLKRIENYEKSKNRSKEE